MRHELKVKTLISRAQVNKGTGNLKSGTEGGQVLPENSETGRAGTVRVKHMLEGAA